MKVRRWKIKRLSTGGNWRVDQLVTGPDTDWVEVVPADEDGCVTDWEVRCRRLEVELESAHLGDEGGSPCACEFQPDEQLDPTVECLYHSNLRERAVDAEVENRRLREALAALATGGLYDGPTKRVAREALAAPDEKEEE